MCLCVCVYVCVCVCMCTCVYVCACTMHIPVQVCTREIWFPFPKKCGYGHCHVSWYDRCKVWQFVSPTYMLYFISKSCIYDVMLGSAGSMLLQDYLTGYLSFGSNSRHMDQMCGYFTLHSPHRQSANCFGTSTTSGTWPQDVDFIWPRCQAASTIKQEMSSKRRLVEDLIGGEDYSKEKEMIYTTEWPE